MFRLIQQPTGIQTAIHSMMQNPYLRVCQFYLRIASIPRHSTAQDVHGTQAHSTLWILFCKDHEFWNDTLAKEATSDRDISICYDKIPKCVFKNELECISVEKWQKNWNQTTKGSITKNFFPRIEERLNRELHTTQALTTILTGHGNIKAYLYRFKIIASPTYPCGKDDQHIDHLIYECELLNPQRETLRCSVNKIDKWPTTKYKLINNHHSAFKTFINQIPFDSLG
jgi:hypothetical protein